MTSATRGNERNEVSLNLNQAPEPGLYVLLNEVTNPKRDKRTRQEGWEVETFMPGTRFRVVARERSTQLDDDRTLSYTDLRINLCRWYAQYEQEIGWLRDDGTWTARDLDPRLVAVAPHLERVEPSDAFELLDLHDARGMAADHALDWLRREGFVSMTALKKLMGAEEDGSVYGEEDGED